jgi:hypothetical protein
MSRFVPPPKNTVLKTAEKLLSRIDRQFGPEDFVQMMIVSFPFRTEYQDEFNGLLDRGEAFLFNSKTDTKPKCQLTVTTQLMLNLLRIHRRAEEGDFETAGRILEDLYENWLDKVPERQLVILFQYFVHCTCLKMWEKALEALKRAWNIIKLAPNQERYNLCYWDDWFSMHFVMWFFALHSNDYYAYVASKMGLHVSSMAGGRKNIFLKHQTAQDIADLVTPAYYKKARELMPELPT